ncbi:hypothetical protein C8F04DRAFT_1271404 [Mycena alexandri]|uniref:Uncharacterized protein n=1 Tax=Mycena alexandri TaxID=1745969 RepID=A0AAD6WW84_9AGAR|nr:hypothetical protein C8F04DRAFT_1271404 [Mycena alexandri]
MPRLHAGLTRVLRSHACAASVCGACSTARPSRVELTPRAANSSLSVETREARAQIISQPAVTFALTLPTRPARPLSGLASIPRSLMPALVPIVPHISLVPPPRPIPRLLGPPYLSSSPALAYNAAHAPAPSSRGCHLAALTPTSTLAATIPLGPAGGGGGVGGVGGGISRGGGGPRSRLRVRSAQPAPVPPLGGVRVAGRAGMGEGERPKPEKPETAEKPREG